MKADRALVLHLAVLAALLLAHFLAPAYHHANLARIMVLSIYAMGYNIAFGYTGLLWAALWGWMFWGVLPDRWTVLGACIIVAAGLYIWYRETRVARKERALHG